ncbi:MAG: hypothetical protein ACI828_002625 [Flavobacteriales bacterium]|jgi:hypothetical protein
MQLVFRNFMFVCIGLMSSHGVWAQADATYNIDVSASIKLEPSSELINIVGAAVNNSQLTQSIRYVLSINTIAEDGRRIRNEQTGRLVLEVGQQANLSIMTMSAQEESRVILLLLIFDVDDNIIGKDRIIINDDESRKGDIAVKDQVKQQLAKREKNSVNEEDAKSTGEDGVQFKGFVTDDMKTKPGRDFVSLFYSYYQRYNTFTGTYVVSIKEVLAIGNNTKIEVRVGTDIVWQFFARPRTDFLDEQALTAMRRVYAKLRNIKKQKSETIIKY